MSHQQNRPTIVSLAVLALAACAQPTAPEAGGEERVFGQASERQSGAEFDVEVRFAGGATRAEAEALLGTLEIVRARELFPDVELPHAPDRSYDEDEALDASEPTFEVVLHPRNEAAREERFAWRASAALERVADGDYEAEGEEQVTATRQALSLDGTFYESLGAGETWRTPRMRCYAPFTFGVELVGLGNVCVDLGYDGVAGSICTAALDPRQPVVVVHPGPDINPFNKHYFRGRVTAKVSFIQKPAKILAAGWLCLS